MYTKIKARKRRINDMDYINNYSLEGKVALVTGASYGIGFAIATRYG